MDVKKIFANNEKWIANKLKINKSYFKQFSKGQAPEFLYIGCSDSRVTAEELMGLSPGDVFALFTDGVTEAFDPSGEEYGEERLIEALRRGRSLSSQSLLSQIVQDVQRFSGPEQYDDITLMIAKCR